MAEIYSYSLNARQGHMSPDTSDHINSVLSDLGLDGASADSADVPHAGSGSVESATHDASGTTGPLGAPAGDASSDHAGSILTSSAPEPGAHAGSAAPEPPAELLAASAPHAADPPTAFAAPPGADSLPGSHAPSGPAYGSDAFGGMGTDTLWGSDGGAHAALPPTPAGSDTIRSSGGMETIYGGNATIYASGHSATLHTDTVHAGGEGTTMDGSASAQALHTDGAPAFADLPGGSGSDTILLHDGAGGFVPAGEDAHSGVAYPAYDGHGTQAHDFGYGSPDSVVGGDGSDHFALLGYGADGFDAGSPDDGTAAHHDSYLAGGHVTHSDLGTYVSYHDGYDTGYSDPDQLQFKDTVMAG